jgi:hypothetical protein
MSDRSMVIGTVVIKKDGKVVKCVRRMVEPELVEWICW